MSDVPHRVQLSRKKGWKMPANTVNVARPGRWGNPFPVGKEGPYMRFAPDAEGAVGFFRAMLNDPSLRHGQYPDDKTLCNELAGKNLACWCALDQPCHADVLLQLANPDRQSLTKGENA